MAKVKSVKEFVEVVEQEEDENGNRAHFTPKDREYISEMMRGAEVVRVVFMFGVVVVFLVVLFMYGFGG
jgi:hypothetical protein